MVSFSKKVTNLVLRRKGSNKQSPISLKYIVETSEALNTNSRKTSLSGQYLRTFLTFEKSLVPEQKAGLAR